MKFSGVRFDDPKVKWRGADDWELLDCMAVRFYIHDEHGPMPVEQKLVVPAMFRTDGPSVPRGVRWLINRNGRLYPLSIVHDYLYGPSTQFTRHDADRWLRDAARCLGVKEWRVWLIYWSLRAFGARRWRPYRGITAQ